MRAAFYAPMKPPNDPVPSGDRAMARALLTALTAAGVDADLASTFRSRDSLGDAAWQAEKCAEAEAEVATLIPKGRAADWRLWVTYHNYYKAPDLVGPKVAQALDIPYVLIEATRARKRLTGPWARFAQAAEAATDAARVVLYVTERDAEALKSYGHAEQEIMPLPPFLPVAHLPAETNYTGNMISVGMMRRGDKLASYQLIAETLGLLAKQDWNLWIAGDGPARSEVETLMTPFGDRVRFLGEQTQDALEAAYQNANLLFWPGVNEAFGMAYLEAQAAGLTVVAQDRPGVRDVLFPGADYPSPESGATGLAARLDMLLSMPKLTYHLGQDARAHIARHHLLGTAAARLKTMIQMVTQ